MIDSMHSLREVYLDGRIQNSQKQNFTVDRQISDENPELSYVDDLPSYEGKNVVEIMSDCIEKNGHGSIWDVGCGEGNFIMTMKLLFKNKIVCDGLNSFPYHSEERARKRGVNIELGDIQHIFKRNQYDLIVAEQSLQYTQNPLIALKRIYDALKHNGIALLNPLSFQFKTEGEEHRRWRNI